ncbi:MAG TPA: hypothetical protein DDZ89_13505 [Clostridiales bacterium]|nr:hypothetical protein [Clostridiales bacterium]
MRESLCISAVQPVNDQEGKLEGVLGTHMLLSTIDEYLNESARNHNGYAFLFGKNTGEEISSSEHLKSS